MNKELESETQILPAHHRVDSNSTLGHHDAHLSRKTIDFGIWCQNRVCEEVCPITQRVYRVFVPRVFEWLKNQKNKIIKKIGKWVSFLFSGLYSCTIVTFHKWNPPQTIIYCQAQPFSINLEQSMWNLKCISTRPPLNTQSSSPCNIFSPFLGITTLVDLWTCHDVHLFATKSHPYPPSTAGFLAKHKIMPESTAPL